MRTLDSFIEECFIKNEVERLIAVASKIHKSTHSIHDDKQFSRNISDYVQNAVGQMEWFETEFTECEKVESGESKRKLPQGFEIYGAALECAIGSLVTSIQICAFCNNKYEQLNHPSGAEIEQMLDTYSYHGKLIVEYIERAEDYIKKSGMKEVDKINLLWNLSHIRNNIFGYKM